MNNPNHYTQNATVARGLASHLRLKLEVAIICTDFAGVARGLASHLRLKPVLFVALAAFLARRQGIGFASAIETRNRKGKAGPAYSSPGDWLRICD